MTGTERGRGTTMIDGTETGAPHWAGPADCGLWLCRHSVLLLTATSCGTATSVTPSCATIPACHAGIGIVGTGTETGTQIAAGTIGTMTTAYDIMTTETGCVCLCVALVCGQLDFSQQGWRPLEQQEDRIYAPIQMAVSCIAGQLEGAQPAPQPQPGATMMLQGLWRRAWMEAMCRRGEGMASVPMLAPSECAAVIGAEEAVWLLEAQGLAFQGSIYASPLIALVGERVFLFEVQRHVRPARP
jgi:hypothetical protein